MTETANLDETLARFEAAARKHPNFGKALPPACPRRRAADHRQERHETKRQLRDAAREYRAPYADPDLAEPRLGNDAPTGALAPGERQAEFEASGKADSANDRLREFFEHVVKTGQMNVDFSRKFLKQICGNDYINNRVDDMRTIFAERGIKIVNTNVAAGADQPATSHYRLMHMTDGEWAKYQADHVPPC